MALGHLLREAIARDTGMRRERILDAFASVPRERFLGPPPWWIAKPAIDGSLTPRYEETSDPAAVYANVSVALDRERQLYNGSPGTVATWIDALDPREGERAFHVGCGTGYFTAILGKLAGSVVGVDVDEALIEQANDALADYPNVSVLVADGTTFAPRTFDCGLVSAGFSTIPELWLDRLSADHGRLVVPLAVPFQPFLSKGFVFLIERRGEKYAAKMIGGTIIFSAVGKPGPLFSAGDPHEVQSLRRDAHDAGASCWLHEAAYCLSKQRAVENQ